VSFFGATKRHASLSKSRNTGKDTRSSRTPSQRPRHSFQKAMPSQETRASALAGSVFTTTALSPSGNAAKILFRTRKSGTSKCEFLKSSKPRAAVHMALHHFQTVAFHGRERRGTPMYCIHQ